MPKPTRYTSKVFAGSAPAGDNGIYQFGSLAASSPNATTNIATVQALAAWLNGWVGAIELGNSPALEDMNAVLYVLSYFNNYSMVMGVAEWDSGTTYWINSMVNFNGVLYVSVADNNTNHTPPNQTYWTTLVNNSTGLSVDPSLSVATITAGEAITAGNAVCFDFDNNSNYRIFKCISSNGNRKTSLLGLALNSASVTPMIQTWTDGGDLITGNVIAYMINGLSYSTTFATNNNTTLGAIATQIATNPSVASAVVTVTTNERVITITGIGGIPVNFTNISITGGASQTTVTMNTTQNYSGGSVDIMYTGAYAGLSGLNVGQNYYVSTIAGALTAAPTDLNPQLVGQALSTTVLWLPERTQSFATLNVFIKALGTTTNAAAGGTTVTESFNFTSWTTQSAATTALAQQQTGESGYLSKAIFIDGINTSNSVVQANQQFNKTAWVTGTNRSTARTCGGVAPLNGILYILRGTTSGGAGGGSNSIDSYNGSSWVNGVTTIGSAARFSSCFTLSTLINLIGGVTTGGGGSTAHDTYDGTSTSTATVSPISDGAWIGVPSPGGKGMHGGFSSGTPTNTYTWDGSSFSSSIPLVATVNAGATGVDYAGPAVGFSSSNSQSIINGGNNPAGTAVTVSQSFNGTSWGSSISSATATMTPGGGVL